MNKDKTQEIIVRGVPGMLFCGATGNCSMWILGRSNNSAKYKILLETGGEYLDIKKTLSNDYSNLHVITHDSAASSYHMIYKFSGQTYTETKCWLEEYQINGEKDVMSCAEKNIQIEIQLRKSQE